MGGQPGDELFPEHVVRERIRLLVDSSEHFVTWAVQPDGAGAWTAAWELGFVGERLAAASELAALEELLSRLRHELGA